MRVVVLQFRGTLGDRCVGTGGGSGRARLRIVATCFIASRVSLVMERHGVAGVGLLRMARISCAVLHRRVSVVTVGNGTCVGMYCTVSTILIPIVLRMKQVTQR